MMVERSLVTLFCQVCCFIAFYRRRIPNLHHRSQQWCGLYPQIQAQLKWLVLCRQDMEVGGTKGNRGFERTLLPSARWLNAHVLSRPAFGI